MYVNKFLTDLFPKDYVPTVFDNYQINMIVKEHPVILSLWDTAGQPEYDRLRPLSYTNTNIYLICYDSNDKESFENVYKKWIPEVSKFNPKIPYLIVGTKYNPKNKNKLNLDYVKKKLDYNNVLECSAKNHYNLKNIFEKAVELALKNIKKNEDNFIKKNKCKFILI